MKKRKLWLGVIGGLALAVAGLLAVFAKLNQPYTSNVQVSQGGPSQLTYNIDLTPVPKTGTYIAFSYPKGLTLRSTALAGGSSVEDFTFYAKDTYSWTLAIDVARTPTGQLSETSSYLMRKEQPQTYAESTTDANGTPVTIMTDRSFANGFSRVAYLAHSDLVATVSLTGDDANGSGPLQTTFDMVLNSWHWR